MINHTITVRNRRITVDTPQLIQGCTGSDGGTIQHGDMTGMRMTRDMSSMTPDEQLNHLKTDVETMWRDATPEQRKRIKESLTKWSTTLAV